MEVAEGADDPVQVLRTAALVFLLRGTALVCAGLIAGPTLVAEGDPLAVWTLLPIGCGLEMSLFAYRARAGHRLAPIAPVAVILAWVALILWQAWLARHTLLWLLPLSPTSTRSGRSGAAAAACSSPARWSPSRPSPRLSWPGSARAFSSRDSHSRRLWRPRRTGSLDPPLPLCYGPARSRGQRP